MIGCLSTDCPPFLESFYLQVALVTYLWGSFFLYLVVVPSTNLFGICSPTNLAFISPSHFISARQAKIWLATTPHKAISRKRSVQIFETYSKHTAHLFFCENVRGQTILWNHELINFKIKDNERKTNDHLLVGLDPSKIAPPKKSYTFLTQTDPKK